VTGAAVLAYADACTQAAYQSWFPDGGSADQAEDQVATTWGESAVGVSR
jgi:hypothetical protein